jgi:tetratricopeptide (TPR) repeat protein
LLIRQEKKLKRGECMICSKIGSECPHPVIQDNHLIFVMMPFKDFDNVYYAIQTAVEGIEGKDFKCLRADEKYTAFSIWCRNICKNIRKAKYLIVDTTRRNPNVFYELGFSHAQESSRAILITQNVKDAPFDISDLNHIEYSSDKLRDLERSLKKAILELEKEEEEEGYKNKTSDGMILELKSQLREEEKRAFKFKKELHESEEREIKLKKHLKEVETIKNNPAEEAKNQITKLEVTIAELKSKLKFTEESNQEEIERLNRTLKEKEKRLIIFEEEFKIYKKNKDDKALFMLLLDETKRKAEAEVWFYKGYIERQEGNVEKAIEFYTKAIELNADYAKAYFNRGWAYHKIEEYEKAINDYNIYIELSPYDANAFGNLTEFYIITGNYKNALKTINTALSLSLEKKEKAISLYLECLTKKLLDMDISASEKEFTKILKQDFETRWSFELIESWLATSKIEKGKKAFITKKIEQLKKHKV